MRRSYITLFVFNLVRDIDRGKHARLPLDEVFKLCRSRKVIEWIYSEFADILKQHEDMAQDVLLLEALDRYAAATDPSKYGIENSGITMLIDWMVSLAEDESA